MPNEKFVLSADLARVRAEIEDTFLAWDNIIFVSVGFMAAAPEAVLVSIGTPRPDLLALLLDSIVATVLDVLMRHGPERQWKPDIHILKGRVAG